LKYGKNLLIPALIFAITFLAVPSVQSNGVYVHLTSSNVLFSSTVTHQYPNPIGEKNVTVIGVIKASTVAPVCSLTNPPCAIPNAAIYYVDVNGRNYRMILPNSIVIPPKLIGSNAVVTGIYVTPSTFQPNQWTPTLSFAGDIYVLKIRYFYTQPF
jgi:hypothetical protein